jgi:hypothetical protein
MSAITATTTAVTTLIMAIRIDRIRGQALLARLEPFLHQVQMLARDERTFLALARVFTVLLGLAAVTWGAATFPIFWSQLPIERTAAAIVDRETFNPHSLDPLLPTVNQIEQSGYCRPEAVRSAAIIRLRFAEEAIASADRMAIDERLSALQDAIRGSLACAPSDPFLWMILAWLDQTRQGFLPEQLTYLRLSYQVGPYEGWIADKRNRLSLSIFGRLPPDLADAAVREFAGMVNSHFYAEAISILTGPGWPIHDRLLASLKDIDMHQREEFAKQLYSTGHDVVVPGIAPHDPRPW